MDIASIVGLVLGITAVVGGALLEGLQLGSIAQPTAALIVLGGTLGATVLSFPLKTLKRALAGIWRVLLEKNGSSTTMVDEILSYAIKARKDGLLSLDNRIPAASDDFLKKAMKLAVDGTDVKVLRDTMEIELDHIDEQGELDAKVFEAAGGFAPTIGIIGAVLGLIHVMENLSDPSKLGAGIAVAFVATVYGVGSANLIFLPFATKLKLRHRRQLAVKEMMLEGVISIMEGVNPKIIEEKLKGFLPLEDRQPMSPRAGQRAGRRAA
ncbi:MAG: flagellar motor protein [Acidimicrobiia bacterium]|nr:flagellar motor protein [Acidimicrobiia bacterium]